MSNEGPYVSFWGTDGQMFYIKNRSSSGGPEFYVDYKRMKFEEELPPDWDFYWDHGVSSRKKEE